MSDKQSNPEFEGNNIHIHNIGDNTVNVGVNYGTINYLVQQIRQERFKALRQLPRDILNFVGRSEQIEAIGKVLDQGNGATIAISAVSGMGGVGKSALAIRVAHKLKDNYPDAQLYVNLQGADRITCQDPFLVLGGLLVELGIDDKLVVQMDLETRSKWWRSLLSELRAIVVFDNARDAKQVWPLLPGSDGPCAVIVTSRQELSLDNVARLRLGAMELKDARTLLSVMSERSFDAADLELAADVVKCCGYLPLAIKIVGALLRKRSQMTLAEVIAALKVERDRLTAFAKQHEILKTDEYLDVRSSLSLSLKWLTGDERSIFEKVAALPGVDFGLNVAKFVTDLETVQEGLDRLADEQLLEAKGDGRYQFHDLVRLLGREQWEKEEDWLVLEARAIDWYFKLTQEANSLLSNSESIALGVTRFKQEWQNLKAVVMIAASRSIGSVTIEMPSLMLSYSLGREPSSEILPLLELSLVEARKNNDRQGEAGSLGGLGNAYYSLGQYQCAIDFYQQYNEIACEIGDRNGEVNSLGNLGNVYQDLGQYQCAIDFYQQSIGIACEIGDRWGEASFLGNLGGAYRSLGQYQQAIDFYQQSIEIAREIGHRNGEVCFLGNLGSTYDSLGQYQRAIDFHQQSIEIAREIGHRQSEASCLGNLGNVYQSLGQYQRAIDFCQQSIEIAREIGDRNGEATSLGNLGNAYCSLGQYQRAIDFHQQYNEIAREIGDQNGEATSLGNLGNAYYSLGQYQRAIDFHQQHNEIAREIGDRNGEAASLGNLGNVYCSFSQYQHATNFYQRSIEIAREIGNRNGEANLLGNLGNAYQSLGQYPRAIDFHQQSIEIKREIGDRWGIGASLFNMAHAQAKLDNHGQALLNFQQAKLIYEDLQLDHMVEKCNEALHTCNQIITAELHTPPQIAQTSKESTIEGYDREKQSNQPIVTSAEDDRKMNRIFYFCVGLVICFVVWKVKN